MDVVAKLFEESSFQSVDFFVAEEGVDEGELPIGKVGFVPEFLCDDDGNENEWPPRRWQQRDVLL